MEISKSNSKKSNKSTKATGKVTSSIYLGSIIQYNVQIDDGPSIVITQNNSGSENFKDLVVGDTVDVAFPEAATYILPT